MWRITFSLLECQQPFHVSKPAEPPEKQNLRLAQFTCPRPCRWEPSRALSRGVGVGCCCPATRAMSAVDAVPPPLASTRQPAGGHPASGHAPFLLCAEPATAGRPLRRAPRVRRPQCRAPSRAGCGGGRERRMLSLRRRGAALAPSFERSGRAGGLRCSLMLRRLPCPPCPPRSPA